MLPFILIALLICSALSAYLPLSERRLRDLGVLSMLGSSVVAVYLAYPGLSSAVSFGPSELWYLDKLSALMLGLIALISLSVAVMAHGYFGSEHRDRIISDTDIRHYYGMAPLLVAAMYVVTLSNHLGLAWLALEATILATTLLVAFYRKQAAIEAAWKSVLLCSLGLSLALVGIIFLLAAVGSGEGTATFLLSNLRDHAGAGQVSDALARWAFVFMFVGFGTKLGLVPMHTWLPDAHSKAPSPVSALLSGLLLSVVFITLLRVRQIVDLALNDGGGWTGKFFLVFGCLSIAVPALVMIVQKNYKRLLAYSSIEHMGLMAFAVGLGPAGLIPALMHLPAHALLKSSLFMGTGALLASYKTSESKGVFDAFRRLPKTTGLFGLCTLMLLGLPVSAIFASQTIMLGLGLQRHLLVSLLVLVALSVACVAMLRHVYGLLWTSQSEVAMVTSLREPWTATHAVVLMQLLLVFALGIYYLTPQGLAFMITLAQTLSPGLL